MKINIKIDRNLKAAKATEELKEILDHWANRYSITYIEALGIIEIIKTELISDLYAQED